MTIPTDRLREIANPVYVPCVGQDEAIAIATELLACREELAAERERFNLLSQRCDAAERERDAYRKAKQENDERFMLERDAARAEAEKLRDQRDRLLRAVRGAGCSSTMARLADEIEESDDRPIPCETCDATGKIDQRLGGYA